MEPSNEDTKTNGTARHKQASIATNFRIFFIFFIYSIRFMPPFHCRHNHTQHTPLFFVQQ
jgi:hypothetical protein